MKKKKKIFFHLSTMLLIEMMSEDEKLIFKYKTIAPAPPGPLISRTGERSQPHTRTEG